MLREIFYLSMMYFIVLEKNIDSGFGEIVFLNCEKLTENVVNFQ